MSDTYLFDSSIIEAAKKLLNGELVAFPTETVYGLGADAENPDAVAKIYQAKGRPANHPLIVHIPPDANIQYWTSSVPEEAFALMEAFWPGPLTLILPKADHIPSAVSGGQNSIGIRCPSHPVAQQLLKAFAMLKTNGQGGVAAPSANKFGHVSPTSAAHVLSEFPEEIASGILSVLEGDDSEIGIESTIVDLSRVKDGVGAVLLRPGHITRSQLAEVLGYQPASPDKSAPRVSGSLKAHYAPNTPLQLIKEADLDRLPSLVPATEKWAVLTFADIDTLPSSSNLNYFNVSTNAQDYAHDIYALLRQLDTKGFQRIMVQSLPQDDDNWEALNDRLQRAAAAFE